MTVIPRAKFNVTTYVIRNLKGRRLRTYLTVSGIAVCVALFVLFNSLGAGLDNYISEQAGRTNQNQYEEMSKLLDGWLYVLTSILMIILAVAVLNTMLIAVSERQNELGTLKALGFTRRQIRTMILLEAMIITSLAFVIGSGLGISWALICDFLFERYAESGGGLSFFFAPAQITFITIVNAAIISVVVGTLAAFYPAIKAASIKPQEALRYE